MPDDDEILSKEQEGVGHIPPKCKVPYSEICPFEETGEIVLFHEKNYKVSISVVLLASMIDPVNSVFDTGAGSNLIGENVSEE